MDAWAAAAPGNLALNVTASSGALTMQDASGAPAAGSGSRAIHLTGTLAQLDAALKSLSFTAATANASVSLDVWDQSGLEGSKTIAVAVTHPGVGVVGRGAAGTHLLASQSPQVVDNASNVQIVASAGDHIIFIGGTGDVVRATGGTETIHAYRGQNTIVTGAGNDTIRYAGAGNVIDAGAGNNALMDSGGNNTIVLAAGGQGYDERRPHRSAPHAGRHWMEGRSCGNRRFRQADDQRVEHGDQGRSRRSCGRCQLRGGKARGFRPGFAEHAARARDHLIAVQPAVTATAGAATRPR